MRALPVVYEDDDIIVIDKPSGLAVQGGERVRSSVDDLLEAVLQYRPHLVHRLDKDTSGLLLVAKTKESAAAYARLFAGRGVRKTYLAVCAGLPERTTGSIDVPVDTASGTKEAFTAYTVKASSGDAFSLLEIELGTGRMHQIRVHLAGIGNPILGDDKYGDFALNKRLRKTHGLNRLLLHAHKLETTARPPLVLRAPPPDYFLNFLAQNGLSYCL